MEKEDGKYCDFCSEPENPSIGTCTNCGKDVCEKHQGHGCTNKPIVIKTNLDRCHFCEKDKVRECSDCGKDLCDEHTEHHDCQYDELEVVDPSQIPDDLKDGDVDSENEIIDKYNENIEKENLDTDRHNKQVQKKIIIGFAIVAFALVASLIIVNGGINFDIYNVPTGFVEHVKNNEMISDADLAIKCEAWNIEGKKIVEKYGDIAIDYWSQADYERAKVLESLVVDNCIETKQDILLKLDMCTDLWVDLNSLIEFEMEERVINSLPEDKQEEYNTKYTKFFREKCHVIVDQITSSEKAQEFYILNSTKGTQ